MRERGGQDAVAPAEEAASRLAAVREELRLKSHLAGMEARDYWDEELLPQLEALEERLGQALRRGAGEARVQLHLAWMELRAAWDGVEPRLLDLVDRVGVEQGSRLADLVESAGEAFRRVTRRLEGREESASS